MECDADPNAVEAEMLETLNVTLFGAVHTVIARLVRSGVQT